MTIRLLNRIGLNRIGLGVNDERSCQSDARMKGVIHVQAVVCSGIEQGRTSDRKKGDIPIFLFSEVARGLVT